MKQYRRTTSGWLISQDPCFCLLLQGSGIAQASPRRGGASGTSPPKKAYDACDLADPWKVYDPSDLAASDRTVADHLIGMWVKATAATILPSDGTLPSTTTIGLCEGWNLIGLESRDRPRSAGRRPRTQSEESPQVVAGTQRCDWLEVWKP